MPETIAGQTTLTVDELEREIRKANLSNADAQKARIAHQRKRLALLHSQGRSQIGAGEGSFGGTALDVASPVSAGLNFANQAFLGAPAAAASAIGAPLTAARRGIGLGNAFELNRDALEQALNASPIPAVVGRVGAFVAPGTAARGVAEAGFRATGGVRFAKKAAELATEGRLARSAAAQLGSALMGSVGATTAAEAGTRFLSGYDSPTEAIKNGIRAAVDPTNLLLAGGLAVAGGAVTAAARAIPNQPVLDLIARAKRLIPRFTPSPDQLRDPGGFLSDMLESLGRSAAGRRAVNKYLNDSFYQPLKVAVNGLRTRTNPRLAQGASALRSEGAEGLRGLLPTEQGMGEIRGQIQQIGRRAFGQVGGNVVPEATLRNIDRTVAALEARASAAGRSVGERGGELSRVFEDLRLDIHHASHGRGGAVTIQMLDNVRQRLAPIAQFDALTGARSINNANISARDVREAKTLYRVLSAVEKQSSPVIERAFTQISELRRANEAFRPLANASLTDDDVQLVRTMFTAKDFGRRWAQAEKMLPQDKLQALRGVYLHDFLVDSIFRRGTLVDPKSMLNGYKMRNAWKGTGQFRSEVFDRVLPGVRSDLDDLGQISDLVYRGLGRQEGSATARRGADMAAVLAAADTVYMTGQILTDPSLVPKVIGRVLGAVGSVAFINSMIAPNGAIGSALNRLASGGVATPGAVLPAALTVGPRRREQP